MPNLISVTQAGRAPDFLVDRLEGAPGNFVKGRLAGAALKNPALAPILDLIFPQPVASGTLTDVIKKHGYEAAPDQVFTGPPGSYKYDGTDVNRALKQQQSQMDAGISGTFVPVR
jgi:hypothetical protein